VFGKLFPRLIEGKNCRTSSGQTWEYNCVAWALGIEDKFIWPDMVGEYFWPDHLPRGRGIDNFLAFFRAEGFQVGACANYVSHETIAIYMQGPLVEHIAWCSEVGFWESKLGDLVDVVHASVDDVGGGIYGEYAMSLSRLRRRISSLPDDKKRV
jgi:hypothetical protein